MYKDVPTVARRARRERAQSKRAGMGVASSACRAHTKRMGYHGVRSERSQSMLIFSIMLTNTFMPPSLFDRHPFQHNRRIRIIVLQS